jgi:hypothetical protein
VDEGASGPVSAGITVPRETGDLWGTGKRGASRVEHRTVSKDVGRVSPALHSVVHTSQLLLPSRMRAISSVTCSKVWCRSVIWPRILSTAYITVV